MWLLDDIGKAIYVVVRKVPSQFWICAFLQVSRFDLNIQKVF
jgi:hypothetical protein